MDVDDDIIEVTSVDDASMSSTSEDTSTSHPLNDMSGTGATGGTGGTSGVDSLRYTFDDSQCHSPTAECESPTADQFNESAGFGGPALKSRMPIRRKKHNSDSNSNSGNNSDGNSDGNSDSNIHMSFRNRSKKKEMRRGSFTYKQVSDSSTPTAHRKQLFSKRSACVLTECAEEEERQGKHVKVNGYHFLKTLGKGAYGEVRLATKDLVEDDIGHHTSRYAIKVMRRALFEERKALPFRGRRHTSSNVPSVEQIPTAPNVERSSNSGPLEDATIPSALLQEINVMKRLAHSNLVKLKEIINDENSKYLFLVLEYMQGGTVMIHDEKTNKYVYALTKTVMLESTARRVFKDLASALSYMHANHIAHRDIKPDNLLIDFEGNLKLSDFGVSAHFESDRKKHSISMKALARSTSRGQVQGTEGTFNFYSPEMCFTGQSRGYNAYMADLWASAVCLWIFVFGTVPFQSGDVTELFRTIREVEPPRPHRLSPELDNLLGLMMRKDVTRRPSCMDVRHHCWVTETPLAQHAEVILLDSEVNAVASSALSTTISVSPPTSSPFSCSLDKMKMGVGRKLVARPLRAISPAVKAKIMAWMQRARKACASRLLAFVVKGQAEMNSLIRKAVQKENSSKDDASDGSSYFSMGSADSNEEEDDDESVVSLTDMMRKSGTDFETVFGRYGDSFDDIDDDPVAMKRRSAPASMHLGAATTHERNIFQRGIHKIEKRILELQKTDSNGKSEAASDEEDRISPKSRESSRARRSLVGRGIHKVVKKISFSGTNTDKHLQEDEQNGKESNAKEMSASSPSGSPYNNYDNVVGALERAMSEEEEEEHLQKSNSGLLGWFSRTKTT